MKKLIYFHGFGSSAASNTVKSLAEGLSDKYEVIAPDIPVDPSEALPFLKELCLSIQPDLIAGSSMGGMYCQQMFGFKRIIVNPAFFMSKYSHVLQVGTFPVLNSRKDGATHFTITPSSPPTMHTPVALRKRTYSFLMMASTRKAMIISRMTNR